MGEPAPEVRGTTLDGSTFDLASLRGRPVIVNFWASWCIPCREEFPLFADRLAAHAGDGFAIVGVTFRDDPGAARAFVGAMGASWPTVVDPDGAIAARYGVVAPPMTFFIARDGVIRSRQVGQLTGEDFDRQYTAIVGGE